MKKIEKHPLSFRFKPEVVGKLDKIMEYHQQHIFSAFTLNGNPDDSILLSRRMMVQGLIEERYNEMMEKGQIQE